MIGLKITATYTPINNIVTPDPTSGAWGIALGHYTNPGDNSGWAGAVFNYTGAHGLVALLSPAGLPTFAKCNYVNTMGASIPAIQMIMIWNITPQETNIATLFAAFEEAAETSSACTALTAFDTSGDIAFEKLEVEEWSDEPTI